MNRVFFEEKQKLPPWLRWLVVFGSLGAAFPILRLLYFQTVLAEPASVTDSTMGLIMTLLVIVFAGSLATWMISSMYLEVKIDSEGINVRYYPHQRGMRIEKLTISGFEARKLQFRERFKAKRGRRFRQYGDHQVYSMGGNQVIEVRLTSGTKIVLGTANTDSMLWAMKKLLSPT